MSSAQKIIQAAAGNAAGEGLAVEDVFSTYLYTGNSSTQTITNGIDLDGEGGLVWFKTRNVSFSGSPNHYLIDTERGVQKYLSSEQTAAEGTNANSLTSFNSDGFTVGNAAQVNVYDLASWTFRKAPKFFDVVTYTGDGTAGRTVSHNLGSTPGFIAIKATSASGYSWFCYHRGLGADYRLALNLTNAAGFVSWWDNTEPTSTEFTLGSSAAGNGNGIEYVAYLFAHNDGDGEFGENADQDIIKCGSYTGNGSADGPEIDLGFEPQWLLIKNSDRATDWYIVDNMRGLPVGSTDRVLFPNAANAEENIPQSGFAVTASGFKVEGSSTGYNDSGEDMIYIAIRRGPMKTPEAATEVFKPILSGDATGTQQNTGFPVDMQMLATRISFANAHGVVTRMLGASTTDTEGTAYLITSSTTSVFASGGGSAYSRKWNNEGYEIPSYWNGSSAVVFYNFRRAPGFFDVVAYVGTGSATTVSHNLGVAPEMMIIKSRDVTRNWAVYAGDETDYLVLNKNDSSTDNDNYWNDTAPTSSVFTVGVDTVVNNSSENYIAYLFATLPGISKVGSYTGDGTASQTIDCGFSNGARFVLIKRTDGPGNWIVFDSERGIVAGNDPLLELDTTDAEQSSGDNIDPVSSGFAVTSDYDKNLNANGRPYIFLAIA